MADSSFDIVSKVDRMELDNALNQASREVSTRFDFKDTGVKIEISGERILVEAETEERAKAALEVLKEKMIKRNVSLKHLEIKAREDGGKNQTVQAVQQAAMTGKPCARILHGGEPLDPGLEQVAALGQQRQRAARQGHGRSRRGRFQNGQAGG